MSNNTSRKELHYEVEVHLILEAVEHLDHPQAVCLDQDVPLSTNMTNLANKHYCSIFSMQFHVLF